MPVTITIFGDNNQEILAALQQLQPTPWNNVSLTFPTQKTPAPWNTPPADEKKRGNRCNIIRATF